MKNQTLPGSKKHLSRLPKEQAENKLLREKLTELNTKVPRSYRIKNDQIVKREGYSPT